MRIAVALALVLVACRTNDNPDPDGDGVNTADGDCQPYNAAVAPGMPEVCNGIDDDCDGTVDNNATDAVTSYTDVDGDGFGDPTTAATSCTPPAGTVSAGTDCDDTDPSVHPGAAETDCADPVDRNCDGSTGYTDADGDGVPACNDCDDSNAAIHPGAAETCDGVDDNCDGSVDENATDGTTYYIDLDGDGAGSSRFTVVACEAPAGYVTTSGDCDDLNPHAAPGLPEVCDGVDNDCNGRPDDGVGGEVPYYYDGDNDGYGDANKQVTACSQPVGYSRNFDDCDDTRSDVHPGAAETTCNDPTDYNCDGSVGADDADGDGFPACSDCDDARADVHPGATEACDGVDNNCDGQIDELAPTWYADIDGDGHGGTRLTVVQCTQPGGFVASHDDCDDLTATIYPGATETCDGKDSNCDGVLTGEGDSDHDGALACNDCDDADPQSYPGAYEVCDGKDNDCDSSIDEGALGMSLFYADADNDGHGDATRPTTGCAAPTGYVASDDDCNDGNAAVHPGAAEVCGGGDENCNGVVDEATASNAATWYLDADGDGSGGTSTTKACAAPTGYVASTGDCDDLRAAVHPGATETCNGVDDDCANGIPANEADADNDGYRACAECDDTVATIHPGAIEVCNNKDDNCNGVADENASDGATLFKDADGDGYGISSTFIVSCKAITGYAAVTGDCNDALASVNPGQNEICNSVDDDCDGQVDEGAIDAVPWFRDADNDGHGTPANFRLACAAPSGFVSSGDDCLDSDKNVHPGATEVPYDGIDQDCNGSDLQIRTCKEFLAFAPGTPSGAYAMDFDGSGPGAPVTTYCDMVTDGGGWTLAAYAFTGSTSCSGSNQQMHSLKYGGGSWNAASRGATSASVPSVALGRASTEVAYAMTTNGSTVSSGPITAYALAWKVAIPDPTKLTFINNSYLSGNFGPADNQTGPCVPVTVKGIVGDGATYSRYTLQNVLGVTWTDTYPTGYGVANNSNCYNENAGPMFTSIFTGDRSTGLACGGAIYEADIVYHGDLTYAYHGSYSASGWDNTGSTSIWFR